MQARSDQKHSPWTWPFSKRNSSARKLREGTRRTWQQRRGCLAPERLEARVLLSFTPVPNLSLGGGQAAWTDFDNDGWVDVVAGGTLYQNNNGTFTSFGGGFGEGIWGDYDNDGFDDFFSYGGGLLHNNGGTGFTNESFKLPSLTGPQITRGASWGDFNADGFLDLYIGNYETWPTAYYADNLILNNGGQSFTLTWTQGLDAVVTGGRPRPARGVSTIDFDEDGDLDVYVSNYRLEPNALWQNDGQGNITDVASSKGVEAGYGHTIGSAIGDFDNDGHLDVFAGNFSHPGQSAAKFIRNLGPSNDYDFQIMSELTGGDWQESYASASLADYDNDGDLDLYFTTVYGGDAARLYRNNGNWSFSNVTSSEGLGGQPSTYQGAWADYDHDGDLDLLTAGTLYRNDTSGNWLKVELIGDGASVNTTAIGAIVRVDAAGQTMTRQVETGTGEGNQNDTVLHFGLGSINVSVPVEVTWPDGTVRTVRANPNETLRIPYNLTALSEVEIGEVGQIASLTHVIQTIQLNRNYENPVVFAQSASTNGTQPVSVRVNNVQSDRFDIFLTEPSNENGVHGFGETVTYVVLEAGSHILGDGTRLEVGTVDTAATVGGLLPNQWEAVSFTTSFDATPVVLSQIQTKSAFGANYLNTRHLQTSNSHVVLALEQEEATTTPHTSESIGYLAIDRGVGIWNDMAYDARTTAGIGGDFNRVNYSVPFATVPSLLASLTSYVGSDNAHLRYTNPSASGVQLKVGEDTTADTETAHFLETASYLAIGGQGLLTALEPQVSIGEVGTVTNLTDASRVIVLDRAYDNPVVFAQSVSTEGQAPVVVRVTNIQSDRFRMFLAEASNDDGTHKAETVSYIVLEAGVHQLIDGTRLEVGTTHQTTATVGRLVTNQWEQIVFSSGFVETPVVLTQIQTTNGGSQNYLKTRQTNPGAYGFRVGLEPEEAVDVPHSAAETVGYLAIEEGSGKWGVLRYEAGNTAQTVTDQFAHHSFGQYFQTPPAFLSSMGSYGGQDNASVRYTDLDGSGVRLKVDEDTTVDTETTHSAEIVSYLAIGGQGALTASLPLVDVGEVGQIVDLTNTPEIVTLRGQYDNPVVFAQSASANGGQPVTVRVRNVRSNKFEIFLTEPSNEDGTHGAETVTYLILEAGVHQLHDGTRVEVGVVTTDATVHKNLTNEWETVNFSSSFEQTPVVLSQIQTLSTGGANYLNTRQHSVSPATVLLALEQDEASGSPHVAETIGYMAIEAGTGVWSGLVYETSTTANVVWDDWYDLAFDSFFNDSPVLLSSLATYNGVDNANVRYTNLGTGGVQLKVSEDDSADTELTHAREAISFFAIGESGLLTAVAPPPQVTAFVRDDGNDAYDVLGTIQYTFDEDVTVTADVLQLTNDSVGGGPVDLTGIGFNYDAGSLTATWDFGRLPPLSAAWYTVTLDATKVTNDSGLMLDGNGDGVAGDPYVHSILVARRGDVDLDSYINITDFNTLAQHFDPLGLHGSNDWSRADFDRDGDIDITDFNALMRNFSPLGYAPLSLEPQVSIGEVGTVTNLTDASRVIVLDRAYDNPVVFAQSVSTEGQAPVVVRVTNIQSDRFRMFLAEASNDDGTHKAETVSYIVLEAGVHQLIDGTRLEVGTTHQTTATVGRLVTNQWEQIVFSSGFVETPVVLTQIQTTNGGSQNYLKTRQTNPGAYGFRVGLEPEEAVDVPHSAAETVGYLAIEEGSGKWGVLRYEAGNTAQTVTDQFAHHSFGQYFQTPPAFLSSMGSYGGQDNASVRYTDLDGSGVRLKVDEDTTVDTETTHSAEIVSYLAIGGQGALTASLPLVDVGEVGQIVDLTNTPEIVTLRGQYDNPVVFAQSASANGGQPVTVRVRNVRSNKFEIFLTEPSNEDGTHGAETVTYLILEAGVHQLHDGTRVEVGVVTTDATVHKNLTNEWETVNFSSSFEQTPVVLSQIQTLSTGGANYLNTRQHSVSPATVLLALEQDEASGSPHVAETIGYMAIEAGTGVWSGLVYETSTTANVVWDDWYDLAFDSFFNDSPVLLSSLATYNGVDNANVRYTNLGTGGVQLKVSEDDSADTELTHAREAISFFAIGESGLLTAVAPPPQVTAFVRDDGNDAYDVLGTIQYTFDEDVTVTADVLQLTNDSVGGGPVDLTGIGFNYDAGSLTATWDFGRLPPLSAAWYTVTLDATKVTNDSGLMLDGNGDGVAGDPYVHSILVARRGDVDLDSYINITDFNTLMRNFSPLGYDPLSSIQASSVTTGGATVTVINTGDAAMLSVNSALSDMSTSSGTGLVDRAYADWDETTGDLVMPYEFSNRRRLRRVDTPRA